MKEKHHADLRKAVWPDVPHSQLAVAIVTVPDDFRDPGLV